MDWNILATILSVRLHIRRSPLPEMGQLAAAESLPLACPGQLALARLPPLDHHGTTYLMQLAAGQLTMEECWRQKQPPPPPPPLFPPFSLPPLDPAYSPPHTPTPIHLELCGRNSNASKSMWFFPKWSFFWLGGSSSSPLHFVFPDFFFLRRRRRRFPLPIPFSHYITLE